MFVRKFKKLEPMEPIYNFQNVNQNEKQKYSALYNLQNVEESVIFFIENEPDLLY
jgi:hypothetical protein